MDKQGKLNELIAANPKAQAQAETVRQASAMLRAIRELGRSPQGYGLEGPFADRSWFRRGVVATRAR